MNIYYLKEPIGPAPIYDCVLSKKVHKWDFQQNTWVQGKDKFKTLDKSYKKELRIEAEIKSLYFTIEHGRLPLNKFSIDYFLETVKRGYDSLPTKKGHLFAFLFVSWHLHEWTSVVVPSKMELKDIIRFGFFHDLRSPQPWVCSKDTLNFPDEILKQLPKAIK